MSLVLVIQFDLIFHMSIYPLTFAKLTSLARGHFRGGQISGTNRSKGTNLAVQNYEYFRRKFGIEFCIIIQAFNKVSLGHYFIKTQLPVFSQYFLVCEIFVAYLDFHSII